jgi:hypothetical protein
MWDFVIRQRWNTLQFVRVDYDFAVDAGIAIHVLINGVPVALDVEASMFGDPEPMEIEMGYFDLPPTAVTAADDFVCAGGAGDLYGLWYKDQVRNVSATVRGAGSQGHVVFAWPLPYFTDNAVADISEINLFVDYHCDTGHNVKYRVRTIGTGSYTDIYSDLGRSSGWQSDTVRLVGSGGLFADMSAAVAAGVVCGMTGQVEIQLYFQKTGGPGSMEVALDYVRLQCYITSPSTLYRPMYGLDGPAVEWLVPVGLLAVVTTVRKTRARRRPE